MSTNDPKNPPGDTMTRKQRRAAERAGRKGTSDSAASGIGSGGGSGPSMLLVSVAAVVIGLVAVLALVVISGGLGSSTDVTGTVSKPPTPAPAAELRQGRTLVKPGATPPVIVEAYEDPQCPACGLFTERIEPLLIAEHVENGTVSYTYHDFAFLGDESLDAAIAMRVAEDMDGKFWDFHQAMFYNQQGENQGGFSRDRLGDIAQLVGLDRAEFLTLMDDPKYRQAVEADNATGRDLGVNSTPTIIVNGEIIRGVPTWDDLDRLVNEAVAAAGSGA